MYPEYSRMIAGHFNVPNYVNGKRVGMPTIVEIGTHRGSSDDPNNRLSDSGLVTLIQAISSNPSDRGGGANGGGANGGETE